MALTSPSPRGAAARAPRARTRRARPGRVPGTAALAAVALGAALLPLAASPASAVVGGAPASAASYPWLAAVGSPVFFVRPAGQFCGGVLIKPDQLLTAGHCVSVLRGVPGLLNVTFGRDDLSGQGGESVQVKSVKLHPEYSETSFKGETVSHHDLALLTLARRVDRPTVALGSPGSATSGVVAGWGTTSESDWFNTRLRSAQVPLPGDAACKKAYGGSYDASDMACAGSPKADTCQFDSGGPLIAGGRVVALTSWAYGCAKPGYPGVYTRVTDLP
ncbi:serine protease [Actinomadura violacea]|uniref:Serine protease n=1 Tax=Actinomadura violacea TaxID=2819934 RepID=A0ABS3RL16_9ACTN|nr:serine protease [Actinomadura violacea]MBO2457430.1 serine protease [Actinomadura violacea]